MPQEARKALQLAIALQLVIDIDIVVIDILYKILLKIGALLLFANRMLMSLSFVVMRNTVLCYLF